MFILVLACREPPPGIIPAPRGPWRFNTLAPAEIFGIAARAGSLEVGSVANLVVTDGDLLEPRPKTVAYFIDGRPVPLGSRHEQL